MALILFFSLSLSACTEDGNLGTKPTISVAQGGTGANSFDVGECLYGNGTDAVYSDSCAAGSMTALPESQLYVGSDTNQAEATSTVTISNAGELTTSKLAINGETFTDLTGTGLTNVGGVLTAVGGSGDLVSTNNLSDVSSAVLSAHNLFDSSIFAEATVVPTDKILMKDVSGSNVLKTVTAQSIADLYSGATYTAGGTLLDLTTGTFSVNEGTLTNGKLCTYVTGTGIVCNTDAPVSYLGGTNLTLSGSTFNVDDAFIVNNANDVMAGTLDAEGLLIEGYALATSTTVCMSPETCQFQADGTDDDVQIQAAIDSLGGSGRVFIKAANYLIGSTITITTTGVVLQGDGFGTVLTAKTNLNANVISITGSGVRNVTVKNLQIDGKKVNNTSGHGIYINTPYTSGDTLHKLIDLYIRDNKNSSIFIDDTDTRVVQLDRVTSYSADGYGFRIAGSDHMITSCIAEGSGLSGFLVKTSNVHFIQCKAFGCGRLGASNSNLAGFELEGAQNVTFTGCEAQENWYNGFFTESSGEGEVSLINSYAMDNGTAEGENAYGVRIWAQSNWTIIGGSYGNYIATDQAVGISIAGGGSGYKIAGVTAIGNTSSAMELPATGVEYPIYGDVNVTGTLVSDGLTMGANENITLGSQTLDHDGTDFNFNDSVDINDGTHGMRIVPGTSTTSLIFY